MTIKVAQKNPGAAVHHAAPPSQLIARNAFTHLYNANQNGNLAKRPGWPDAPGEVAKLNGGAVLQALGIDHLPKGSKAAHAIQKVIHEGVDGDQSAYHL